VIGECRALREMPRDGKHARFVDETESRWAENSRKRYLQWRNFNDKKNF